MKEINIANPKKYFFLKAFFWILAMICGCLEAMAHLYHLSSEDSVSYLDIASAYLQGNWQTAINANWSPLYSWLLAVAIFLFKPSTYWEFATVKIVNFSIFIFTLFCFDFLLSGIIFSYQQKNQKKSEDKSLYQIPKWVFIVSGYSLFLLFSIKWIGLQCDTPDMCVAAFIYLASGLVLRLKTGSATWLNFIILGLVLGLGYLSKSIMFPLAFIFLGVSLFSVGELRKTLPKTIVALLIFTILVTPFVTTISIQKEHLTIGEAGKLSYAWYVSPRAPERNWQGKEPGSGIPKHPSRQIFSNPAVFEFSTPISGTYPLWYDPTYWNEGLTPQYSFKTLVGLVRINATFYYNYFFGSIVFGYLILVIIGRKFRLSLKGLIANWQLLILAGAGLGAFMVITNQPALAGSWQPLTRYIAPFAVLLFAGFFSSVRLVNDKVSAKLIAIIAIAYFFMATSPLYHYLVKDFKHVLEEQHPIHWQVADRLTKLGIQPGDQVAIFGEKYCKNVNCHIFWARLARVKIIAEISDWQSFWTRDAATQAEVFKAVERTGAKIIVHKPQSPEHTPTGLWQEIGNTGYYIHFFKSGSEIDAKFHDLFADTYR